MNGELNELLRRQVRQQVLHNDPSLLRILNPNRRELHTEPFARFFFFLAFNRAA